MHSPSSSRTPSTTALERALETPGFNDQKDKFNELRGLFECSEKRARLTRDLTEIHETTTGRKPLSVYMKHLHYATNIENDIHISIGDKQRALKRISDQMKTWTSLKHPNILPLLCYEWKDTPLLAFHWYKNGNISQYLKTHPDVDRLLLLVQVASGLKFLHSQSIVHGAIKPTNVIVADGGRPMLMDFRMAPDLRMVERSMTMADSGRENVGYMSPELIEEGNYTTASDLYAFASLLLEILSGQPPYYKLSYDQATAQITQRKKPSPEDHQALSSSSPLWELMQRCWSTLPSDRPKMEEVHTSLENMIKRKRFGFLDYVGLLCGFIFHLVLQLIQQLASLKQVDSVDESMLNREVGLNYLLPSLGNELNPVELTARGGYSELHQPAPPARSDFVDDSVLHSGVQLNELPPPLEGKLDPKEIIACGGYSEVRRGTLTRRDDECIPVAIKYLKPRNSSGGGPLSKEGFETRIRRETMIWNRAQHDNTLQFIGFQIVEGTPMLVSPWCENGNLMVYTERHPELTRWDKLKLLCDAARGLEHLHCLKPPIIHGDIKPDNVMITSELRAVLADFGISSLMVDLEVGTGLTTTSGAGGPARYRAIELLTADRARPTGKSDVYSFGMLILATMTGRSPFWKIQNDAVIVLAVADGITPKPEDHSELPPADSLWGLMRRCWNPDPTQRPCMKEIIGEVSCHDHHIISYS
ncbi:hypothetical protein FRC01_012400 [Tulasnella sp. 417]|nr:hypothetical protein FRC01_012400 [Tulasnella sp. 417]